MVTLLSGCQHGPGTIFPIGIYSVPIRDLPTVRAAGFNLVTGPAEKQYLDAAAHLHLGVLASPGASAGRRFQAERARQMVGRFDAHPALWAWYLVDEPDLNGVAPDDVKRAHRFLKNLGARKPTALVLYQGGEALNYANIADITMVDRYPIPWLPLANFPQHVQMARLALGKNKPLIAVIQAFVWSSYPKLLPDEKNFRPPTSEELRCMTYCALARKASGLFYYCFDDRAWKIQQHPQVWEALKKVTAEVNERLPLFRAEQLWWPFVHECVDPSTRFNAALESSVIPALLRVKHGNGFCQEGEYLLTVNNTEKKLTYRITLPSRLTKSVPVLGEGRNVVVKNAWLEDEFGPLDVHIYGPIR